ncbi:MAG: hypothetical protein ACI3VK_03240 [Oscillospiraceae bacterium]
MNNQTAKSSWAAAFTVASVWFGTHVGGGFASGNQVIQYFANYGYTSVIFPILAMGLLAIVMYIMMKFAKLSGFNNYKDTFAALYPKPWMEIFFEIFYIVIVLAAMASAVAGAGEVLANFIGITYVGAAKVTMNLIIVAVLILLTIFGIKLVRAASTVLSVAIIVITILLVIFGLTADYDAISAQFTSQFNVQLTEYTSALGTAVWKGVLVYAAFQCVSIPPMIAASQDMSIKGVKRANILGWLMNGLALAGSAWMLTKWYPLLAALQNAGKEVLAANPAATAGTDPIVAYATALGIPNQTVLSIMGVKWLLIAFSVLLFCAFMSTCVTLVYTMIQRFQGYCFPNAIKSEKVRGVIVAALVIAICFAISLLGLSGIVKYAYGYDGYYAILVIIIPAFVWGIPKIKKLEAEKKAQLSE